MNILDLTIIYLACGAPFGVYYYLVNRPQKNGWLKSIFISLLWFPFAIQLLISRVTKRLSEREFSVKSRDRHESNELNRGKKNFEAFLPENGSFISLFELREIIDRYAGLTLAKNIDVAAPAKHEEELFRASGGTTLEISSICLNRRNRAKLLSHQRDARTDFLKMLGELFEFSRVEKLGKQAIGFVKLLKDDEALDSIELLIKNASQITRDISVKELEKDLWKQDIPIQPTNEPIPLHLKALTAAANAPTKD